MHPILIELGPFTIYTYGLFIAAAFLAALGWAMKEARSRHLNDALVPDLGFFLLVCSILGARLLFVLLNLAHFKEHPSEILMFWKGGLVFQGGAMLGVVAVYSYLSYHKQNLLKWADCAAPAVAIGQAVGRLGCLGAGCCYGRECDLPWALTFTDEHSLAPLFTPLHPTQIYHSLASLFVFISLLVSRRYLRKDGQIMGLFLILYPLLRIGIEFFRGDFRGHVMDMLSTTQVIAACLLVVGFVLITRKEKEV